MPQGHQKPCCRFDNSLQSPYSPSSYHPLRCLFVAKGLGHLEQHLPIVIIYIGNVTIHACSLIYFHHSLLLSSTAENIVPPCCSLLIRNNRCAQRGAHFPRHICLALLQQLRSNIATRY